MRFRTTLPGQGPGLAVRANPVDTFEMPTAGRELDQLAQALAQVSPSLGRFSDTIAAREDAEARAKMSALAAQAFKDGKRTLDEVKQGKLAPDANPYFWGYFEEQFGRLTAADFSTRLREYVSQRVGTDGTVDAFDSAAKEFIAEFEKGVGVPQGSEFFQAGYQGAAARALASARMEYAQRAGAVSGELMMKRHAADVRQAVMDAKTPEEALAAVQGRMNALEAILPNRAIDIEELTATAIYEAAAALGNRTLTRDLLTKLTRQDGKATLGTTKAGAELLATAEQRIAAIQVQRDATAVEEIANRVKLERQRVGQELAELASDAAKFEKMTNADLEPLIQRMIAAGDTEARSTVYAMREANLRAVSEDAQYVDTLQGGITTGKTTFDGINKALAKKLISAETHSRLTSGLMSWLNFQQSQADEARRRKGEQLGIFATAPFLSAIDSMRQRTRPEMSVTLGRNLFDRFRANLEIEALQEFQRTGQYPLTTWYNERVQGYIAQNSTILMDIDKQVGASLSGEDRKAIDGAAARDATRPGVQAPPPTTRPLSDVSLTELARSYAAGDRQALDGLTSDQQRVVMQKAAQLRQQQRQQTPPPKK